MVRRACGERERERGGEGGGESVHECYAFLHGSD